MNVSLDFTTQINSRPVLHFWLTNNSLGFTICFVANSSLSYRRHVSSKTRNEASDWSTARRQPFGYVEFSNSLDSRPPLRARRNAGRTKSLIGRLTSGRQPIGSRVRFVSVGSRNGTRNEKKNKGSETNFESFSCVVAHQTSSHPDLLTRATNQEQYPVRDGQWESVYPNISHSLFPPPPKKNNKSRTATGRPSRIVFVFGKSRVVISRLFYF